MLWDAAGRHDLAQAATGIPLTGELSFVQLDVRGDMVEGRAWRQQEPMPLNPTVSARDTTYRAGIAGISGFSHPPHKDFHGVFEYVCITTPAYGDCNENGIPDYHDIASGRSKDCNANEIPDECDIARGTSPDCNANDVPDECDLVDRSRDCNENDVPDECHLASGRFYDCDSSGVLDECEVSPFPAKLAGNTTGLPDSTFLGPPDKVYKGALSVEFNLLDVLVSADGAEFRSVKGTEVALVRVRGDEGCRSAFLARSYSLEGSDFEGKAVRYVRIQGASGEPAGEGRGFELDAVGAIHLKLCPRTFPDSRRGDANDDGEADISDAVRILNWLFLGGEQPGCLASAGMNGDGGGDLSDAVYLLGHLFMGGPEPPAPFRVCGPPTLPTDESETLGCATAPAGCRGK